MPPYIVTDRRTGQRQRIDWNGDAPPTREDLDNIFNPPTDWLDAGKRLGSGVWDNITGLAKTFLPWESGDELANDPTATDIDKRLGFKLETPASRMAKGMVQSASEGIGHVRDALSSYAADVAPQMMRGSKTPTASVGRNLGMAGLNAVDIMGLPATDVANRVEKGDYAGALGSGLTGLVIAEFARRAHAGATAGDSPIGADVSVEPPLPTIRGLLPESTQPRFYAGDAGIADRLQPYQMEMAQTPSLNIGDWNSRGTLTPMEIGEQVQLPPEIAAQYGTGLGQPRQAPVMSPEAQAMNALVPDQYRLGRMLEGQDEPFVSSLPAEKPFYTGIGSPIEQFMQQAEDAGLVKRAGKSKTPRAKKAAQLGQAEPQPLTVEAPPEPAVSSPVNPNMADELARLFGNEKGGVPIGDIAGRIKDKILGTADDQAPEIERRQEQLSKEELLDRGIMFDRRGNLATQPSDFVPPTKGTLKNLGDEKIATPDLPGKMSYEEAAKTIFDDSGRIRDNSRPDAVGQRRLADAIKADTNAIPEAERPTFVDKLKQFLSDEEGGVGFGDKGHAFHQKTGNPTFDDTEFPNWVNSRRAANVEGYVKSQEFKDLDSRGLDGILEFQRLADKTGTPFEKVQNYFDSKFKELTEKGVKVGFKEDYLPQLWDNSAEEVHNVARRLGLKPSFTMKSVLENYQRGLDAGLKPRFEKISDLVGWYESRANKAIADRQFFDYLKSNKIILQKGKAPSHWESLDPDRFPIQKFLTETKGTRGATPKTVEKDVVYTAEPRVAGAINNYLGKNESATIKKLADWASYTKNLALSSGIPKTAFNAHGFNILSRSGMAHGFLKGTAKGLKYMFSPESAKRYVDSNLTDLSDAVKHGLMASTEDHTFGKRGGSSDLLRLDSPPENIAGKAVNWTAEKVHKLAEIHGKLFEDPLFQKMIPALKLEHWKNLTKGFVGKGMDETAAKKEAAKVANETFGGINTEELQRNRDFQNMLRTLVLAPDWAESNMRMGKGVASSLADYKTPKGQAYHTVTRQILYAYTAANVANKMLSGHYMWQNPAGKTMQVYIGRDSKGKDVYFNAFGTAADFARLPYDTAMAISKGDMGGAFRILKNRISLPARSILDLLSNTDQRGQAIYGKDAYGRKIPVKKQVTGITREVLNPTTPQYLQAPMDIYFDKASPLEGFAGATESPLRFSKRPRGRVGLGLPSVPEIRMPGE